MVVKIVGPKVTGNSMITRTYSERRICFLREADFPFNDWGKLPLPLCGIFGLQTHIYIYAFFLSVRVGASESAESNLVDTLNWKVRKGGFRNIGSLE